MIAAAARVLRRDLGDLKKSLDRGFKSVVDAIVKSDVVHFGDFVAVEAASFGTVPGLLSFGGHVNHFLASQSDESEDFEFLDPPD